MARGPGPAGALGLPWAECGTEASACLCAHVFHRRSGLGRTPDPAPPGPSWPFFQSSAPSALPAASGAWFWSVHLPRAERAPHLLLPTCSAWDPAWCPGGRWAGGSRRRGEPARPAEAWGRASAQPRARVGKAQSTQLACVLGGRLPAPLPHPRVDPDLTCTCVDTSPETGGLQAAQGKEVSQRAYWVPHFPPQTLPCSEGTGQSGQCEEQGEAPARCGPQGRPGPGRQKDREGWAPSLKCVSRTHLEHVEEPREASDPGQPPATPSMASPGPLTGCGHLANGPSVPLWRAWGSDPVIHTECVAPASVGSSGAPRPLWTLCGRPPRR